MNHLPEKNLDKIVAGELSPDELFNFWQWLQLKLLNAPKDFDEYWNYWYLQEMKSAFFEACKQFPQYQGFYVDNLFHIDAKNLKKYWVEDSKTDVFEIQELLDDPEIKLPDNLKQSILDVLQEEKTKQD